MAPAERIEAVASAIAALGGTDATPRIVAIDGRSGSGKSTLARALAERLGALRIEGDDFYIGGIDLADVSDEHLARTCIDWQAQRRVLESLKQGRAASFYPFDWTAFDGSKRAEPVLLMPQPCILLDGVYSARPELRDLVDYTVLLEVDDATRQARVLQREGRISDWAQHWWRGERWYFDHQAHPEAFDCVLDNSQDS